MKDFIIGLLIGLILSFIICGSSVNSLDKERAKNGFMEVDGVGYRVQKVSWEAKK